MKFALPAAVMLLAFAVAVPCASAQEPRSPFFGGVPSGVATAQPISLGILDAISRALEHNLGLLNAQERVGRTEGSRKAALADLLPNVSGRISENRQKVNLAAFGFPLPAGVPSVVGPFNVFDARVSVSQSFFDQRAHNAERAESHNVAAANLNVKSARDLVVLVAGDLYLQSLAAAARVRSAQAQVQTAQAIFDQTTRLKEGGIVAGIEVLRAEVQLGSEKQRFTAAQNEFEKTKLQLARVIGLPAGQAFTLSDDLPYVPFPEITLEQALAQALRGRPDYLAAQERLKAAEAEQHSATGERLPTLRVTADYGRIGLTPGDGEQTYSLAGTVNIPIFNGGRTSARVSQTDADLRLRRLELEDIKAGIDFDVRSRFLDLKASTEQMQVASRSRELAAQQLTQARDRFAAGVTSTVEVVQAQEAVATSSEQYIGALYSFNVAKALMARDLGVAEDMARQVLGGVR